jgi:hypothetical protein
MYHAPSKLKLRLRLIVVYTLMVLAVAGLVALIFFIMSGYRFNQYDGKVEQGGLVQFDTKPGGADIWVDQAHLGNKTPAKITVTSGVHTIIMVRDGYFEWRKSVTVQGGTILWLDYARLIPKVLPQSTVATTAKPSSSLTSPDSKQLVYISDAAQPVVSLVNLDTDTPKVANLAIPITAYTKLASPEAGTFTLDSWSGDNRYLLIRHNYGQKLEWLTLDTQGAHDAVNVTAIFSVEAREVQFSKGDALSLYLLTPSNELRRGDVRAKTLASAIMTNVDSFGQYDNSTVTFVTKVDPMTKNRSVGYITSGASAPRLVLSYADDGATPIHFTIAHYYNQNHYVLSYGAQVDILTGDVPSSDTKNPAALQMFATITSPTTVAEILLSPESHRFVMLRSDTAVAVYDLELKQVGSVSFTRSQGAMWTDEFHYATVADGGAVRVYDFDGTNGHDLLSGSLGGSVAMTPNGKYFYGFTTGQAAPELARVKLTTN